MLRVYGVKGLLINPSAQAGCFVRALVDRRMEVNTKQNTEESSKAGRKPTQPTKIARLILFQRFVGAVRIA